MGSYIIFTASDRHAGLPSAVLTSLIISKLCHIYMFNDAEAALRCAREGAHYASRAGMSLIYTRHIPPPTSPRLHHIGRPHRHRACPPTPCHRRPTPRHLRTIANGNVLYDITSPPRFNIRHIHIQRTAGRARTSSIFKHIYAIISPFDTPCHIPVMPISSSFIRRAFASIASLARRCRHLQSSDARLLYVSLLSPIFA